MPAPFGYHIGVDRERESPDRPHGDIVIEEIKPRVVDRHGDERDYFQRVSV